MTIVALGVATVVITASITDLAGDALRGRATALLSIQVGEVDRQLARTEREVAALAASETVAAAARRLGAAFEDLGDVPATELEAIDEEVGSYYRTVVGPTLQQSSADPVAVAPLVPDSEAARYLQRWYTIPVPGGLPPPEVIDAGDGSEWSRIHAQVHPGLSEVVERLEAHDLAIVDRATGAVIYSVRKAPDLATSLAVGPYSGTVLAQAVRQVVEDDADEVITTDLAPYAPYGGEPAQFVVAPVREDGRIVAVLAVAPGLDVLDELLTAGGAWEAVGFGATGETYLVGADGRMRTVARGFVGDRATYLDEVAETESATASEREAMSATGTTATFQRAVDASDLLDLAEGELIERTNWLGQDVLSVAAHVDDGGLDWRVVTEVARSQVAAPIDEVRNQTLVAVAVLVALVTLLMIPWARRVVAPLHATSRRLDAVHGGEDSAPTPLATRPPAEFVVLADSVDRMIGSLRHQRDAVEEAVAERRETLLSLVPPAIAHRIESGDRRVVDVVPQGSIVVIRADDMERLFQTAAAPRATLERAVAALDSLADRHGLVRIKLFGEAYYAGCGLDRPVLDHAPRTVAFAHEARAAVAELGGDLGTELRVAASVASGPVTVGLGGSLLLVYDVWGQTVEAAELLAHAARADELLVSDGTRALLPPETVTVPREVAGTSAWRVVDPDGQEDR